MLALPERRFVVALDPSLFRILDPERYRIWYETTREPPVRPAALIRDTFDARWVLCEVHRGHMQSWPLVRELERDPLATAVMHSTW